MAILWMGRDVALCGSRRDRFSEMEEDSVRHSTSLLASAMAVIATTTCQPYELTTPRDDDDLRVIDIVVEGTDFKTFGFDPDIDYNAPIRVRARRAMGDVLADITAPNFDSAMAVLKNQSSSTLAAMDAITAKGLLTRDVLVLLETITQDKRDSILAFIATFDKELNLRLMGQDINVPRACEEQGYHSSSDSDPSCSGWKRFVLNSTCFLCGAQVAACPGLIAAALLIPEPHLKIAAVFAAILDCLGAVVTCDSCAEKARECHDQRREEDALENIREVQRMAERARRDLEIIQRMIDECRRFPLTCVTPHEEQ